MDLLQSLLESYQVPLLTAFILGLMTAISPCPLATNITATAYIAKRIGNRRSVLMSGLLYSLGRALSYTAIGLILYLGASKFHLQRFFSQYGEKFLGPLLIVLGLVMLNVIRLNFLGKVSIGDRLSERFKDQGLLGALVLGAVFALAFCPYSGALYFGMLIPMTVNEASLHLPLIFAIGTGLPVVVFTYFLAFAAHQIGPLYQKIQTVEHYVRYGAGVVAMGAGVYYVLIFAGFI